MMTSENQLVQITVTKSEFLAIEAALGVLICMTSGDIKEAMYGTAMHMAANGPEPLNTVVQKVLLLHTGAFEDSSLNEKIKETLDSINGDRCTCDNCKNSYPN